jgi:uncharacterized membrane protein SpoIIM required for sporulation
VTLDRFIRTRRARWDELDRLLDLAAGKTERLAAGHVLRLGELYRASAADLALARRRFRGEAVVAELETRVGAARLLVYAGRRRHRGFVAFFRTDYWRIVAERPRPLLVAALLVFVPALVAGGWALHDPAAATGLVPGGFRPATETPHPWHHFSPAEQSAFSSQVLTNNIQVTAIAFAGGITGGVLTVFSLLYNGILLGAIGGLMIGAGNGVGFVDLVTAHGVLEMSCIVVGGAAGLRLGWAIVDPGLRTRSESLAREAQRSVLLVLGTAPWLVLAGVVEGFRAQLATAGVAVDVTVGVALGGLYWGLVVTRGSQRPARLRAQVGVDARGGEALRGGLDDLRAGAAQPRDDEAARV